MVEGAPVGTPLQSDWYRRPAVGIFGEFYYV
jgi:hypothetical protein